MQTTGRHKGAAQYDVVIVGGGYNGLVAAAYLARGGLSVLVLECLGKVAVEGVCGYLEVACETPSNP